MSRCRAGDCFVYKRQLVIKISIFGALSVVGSALSFKVYYSLHYIVRSQIDTKHYVFAVHADFSRVTSIPKSSNLLSGGETFFS